MLILRFKHDAARRSYSVTFLNWTPPWHILKLWFTDYHTFKCLVDEEIEKVYESGLTAQIDGKEAISDSTKCLECLGLGEVIPKPLVPTTE